MRNSLLVIVQSIGSRGYWTRSKESDDYFNILSNNNNNFTTEVLVAKIEINVYHMGLRTPDAQFELSSVSYSIVIFWAFCQLNTRVI